LPQGKKSTMMKKRIQKLNKIGSVRSIVDDDWSPRLKELKNIQKENCHCLVPGLHTKDSETYPLACWVARQRQQYKSSREDKKGCIIFTEERIQKLNDIGFGGGSKGSLVTVDWDERFEQLKAFRNEHGHCRVIRRQGANNQLASWLSRQRVQYKLLQQGKKSHMKEERIQKLNAIGFVWGAVRIVTLLQMVTFDWDERFNQLRAFQDEQGHCRVPQSKDSDTYQLSLWVKLQRKHYKLVQQGKKSPITQERIQKLNGIGFSWFIQQERVSWDERLEELKVFQQKHGHCRVVKSKLNSKTDQLANWVLNQQRRLNMYMRLGNNTQSCDDRIQKLNEIGFDW
jgi:hypothetical protein